MLMIDVTTYKCFFMLILNILKVLNWYIIKVYFTKYELKDTVLIIPKVKEPDYFTYRMSRTNLNVQSMITEICGIGDINIDKIKSTIDVY